MTKVQLMRKMARLETLNDQLMAELVYVDKLMKKVGFTNGLQTVKLTAEEICEEGKDYDEDNDENVA